MSRSRPPLSTVIAVSSRKPPSSMMARSRDTGPTPTARSWSVSPSVWTISMKASITSRCRGRDSAPRAGTSRIQLSTSAGMDSVEEIQAAIACRIDLADHLDVGLGMQCDEAVFLAGKMLVEGSARSACSPHDVGDRGLRVAVLGDRLGKAVEQPLAELARILVCGRVRLGIALALRSLCSSHAIPLVLPGWFRT